jgi:hypothetical protein
LNPLILQEGRFTLGPLQCHEGASDTPAADVYELSDEMTLAPLAVEMKELYFEFRTTACGWRMEILTLSTGGGGNVELSLRLAADNRLEMNDQAVVAAAEGGERLCGGRWHAVVIDRSHLGRVKNAVGFSTLFMKDKGDVSRTRNFH